MKTAQRIRRRKSFKTLLVHFAFKVCLSSYFAQSLSLSVLTKPKQFLGDYIAKERKLPKMKSNDYLVMHDTGSYTHALYSRYNSLQSPAVYGYRRYNGSIEFFIMKKRESYETISEFWGEREDIPLPTAQNKDSSATMLHITGK